MHACCGCSLDAHFCVFEDEAGRWGDVEFLGGEKEGLGVGLGFGVVARADQDVELVEKVEDLQGFGNGLARGAGDDGEGDALVCCFDLFEDFGDGGEFGEEVVVEAFFAMGYFFDGHVEAMALVEGGDDFADGHASPGVEERLGKEGAAVFGKGLLPGDVVQGHGVGDGAIHVEEVGLVGSGWAG